MQKLFGQEIFYLAIEASSNEVEYFKSLQVLKESNEETLLLMEKYNLDAFIGLTRGPAWKTNEDGGDNEAMNEIISFGNGGYAAIGGLPHITIPYFTINGFPVGLSLIGKPWSDKEIISYASALEH